MKIHQKYSINQDKISLTAEDNSTTINQKSYHPLEFLLKFGIINIFIILITVVTVSLVAYSIITPFSPHKFMNYGIVDPESKFTNSKLITIENKFVAWDADKNLDFTNALDEIINAKRIPMITVEPWGLVKDKPYNMKDLNGEVYQNTIKTICRSVEARKKKTIIRWGHEMEQVGSRYPWGNGDSEGFKTAYKFWVDTCRTETKLVDFMWSPAGREGLEAYYPGADYVDIIGLSTYGYPEYEEKALGKKYNFEDHFNERYKRVEKYGKDVYLAEFGVAGTAEYKEQWLKQARASILDPFKYPNLRGVIYFQFFDKEPWVEGINAPDFRIATSLFPFIK
jgi:beta-mannanase